MSERARVIPALMSPKPVIRVLIVDDSAVARSALTRIVSRHPKFEVGAALDGARRAIEWLKHDRVDIVVLDIEMPGLDGLAALPSLLATSKGARVLIVSSVAGEGATATLKALALGAADTLAKPGIGVLNSQFADGLIERMLRLGQKNTEPATSPAELDYSLRKAVEGPVSCLAIGASTGGLHALAEFFAALPPTFDAPILVTQHLPAVFMPFFADQLTAMSKRTTTVASEGAPLLPGTILVAPGNAHLGCKLRRSGGVVKLTGEAVTSRCLPSVDPMFSSIGKVYGPGALGVVLSGMGRDGLNGAHGLAESGASVIVQDRDTSTIWGMPGSIAQAGYASFVGPPRALAEYVLRRGAVR